MTFDSAVNEIKEIFRKHNKEVYDKLLKIYQSLNDSRPQEIQEKLGDICRDLHLLTVDNLDKDLSDFLKRFEENMIESNAEELRNQELNAENLEPMFDKNDLD